MPGELNIRPVLGIYYGRTKSSCGWGSLKVFFENLPYLMCENENLHPDIIEPIGYRAKEHNENFVRERDRVNNLLSGQFIKEFCASNGSIDWKKLVELNSGNYDSDQFLP